MNWTLLFIVLFGVLFAVQYVMIIVTHVLQAFSVTEAICFSILVLLNAIVLIVGGCAIYSKYQAAEKEVIVVKRQLARLSEPHHLVRAHTPTGVRRHAVVEPLVRSQSTQPLYLNLHRSLGQEDTEF